MKTSWFVIATFVALFLCQNVEAAVAAPWVVEADEAKRWITEEDAVVLDTRSVIRYRLGHVKGAVRVSWQDFSQSKAPNQGKLKQRDALQAEIRKLGVDAKRPVVVVGNPPNDWGEDGRIVWMLRYAGHPRVALVNGGHDALTATGVDTALRAPSPIPSDFSVRPSPELLADAEQMQAAIKGDSVILDTRETREFRGKTPYGENRGGHVPSAKHLYFKDLLKDDGTLLSTEEIQRKLAALGATTDTPIIAYCTGGVRSGWMVAALRSAGFRNVKNYAGSMWEWAAGPDAKFPLQSK